CNYTAHFLAARGVGSPVPRLFEALEANTIVNSLPPRLQASNIFLLFCLKKMKNQIIFGCTPITWRPPVVGWEKINVDASFNKDKVFNGLGIVIRDHLNVFGAARGSTCRVASAEEGKALAVMEGILWARKRGIPRVNIETGAEAISLFCENGAANVFWTTKAILQDCMNLFSSFVDICISYVPRSATFVMACTTISIPLSNVRVIRQFDCQNYLCLKPTTSQRFVSVSNGCKLGWRRGLSVRAMGDGQEAKLKKLGLSDEECEASVVAGNIPETPPVPPVAASPAGTPVDSSLPLNRRPRRNRRSPVLRASFQETSLTPANFVYPLFIHEGEEDTPIGAMPGCYRLGWRHGLIEEVAKARDVGVNSIVLFPKVPDALKSPVGEEAYNENGLVPRAIRLLKDKFPDLIIYTDVALDPYNSDGHDGIVREDGIIMNDETVHQLCKQAVAQARAGADVVSPSDMMDGRVGGIRQALDAEGFQHVSIMSYTAKYASAFYGPFREALESNPRFGDKKTYQMNPANYREALVELRADEAEGADILLVKPGLPYLDVVRLLRDNSPLPIAAYQVSGEYSMIKAGGVLKMIDEEKVMMESLCVYDGPVLTLFSHICSTSWQMFMRREEIRIKRDFYIVQPSKYILTYIIIYLAFCLKRKRFSPKLQYITYISIILFYSNPF
ncbi:hypothetical protein GIB67_026653, partial [Kingdonia uniflora]